MECAATVVAGSALTLMSIGASYAMYNSEDYWYDPINNYGEFPEELNTVIEGILANGGEYVQMNSIIQVAYGHQCPNYGKHYFFWKKHRHWINLRRRYQYIGLAKIRDKDNKKDRYVFWYHNRNKEVLVSFLRKVFFPPSNTINVHSVDTSEDKPSVFMKQVFYAEPTARQRDIQDIILEHWNTVQPPGPQHRRRPSRNSKIFIHGPPGTGKTFMGSILKHKLDEGGLVSYLFDNFTPSMTGANIERLALSRAKDYSPVIIVINEIDIFYQQTLDMSLADMDPRLKYTKDKTTFNNMLDDMGKYSNVIVLFTSEKSPEQLLAENAEYRSFLRTGRIDCFINMENGTHRTNNWHGMIED